MAITTTHNNPGLNQFAQQMANRRQRRIELQTQAAEELREAKKPTRPLELPLQESFKRKRAIGNQVLEEVDALYQAAERLFRVSPADAAIVAKSLLSVTLRLAWVQISGKVLTRPEPGQIPHKLWLRQAVTKASMRRLHHAINKLPPSHNTASELLECSRAMLIWLADDQPEVLAIAEVANLPSKPK